MLNQLCVRHKTSIRHFFLLESRKPGKLLLPNGYITGWGRTSSILLSSGLLKAFPYAEIRSVIAHELGHHIHRTTLKKQLLKSGLLLAELFLYAVLYHWLQELLLNHSLQELLLGPFTSGDVELPVVLFIVILALSMRLGCFFVRQAYSRRHEYLADEFALRATLDVPAFKNSMLRLGNMNNIPLILSPSQERSRTHPAKISRLRHADEFAARQARDAPAGGWY